jgi:hypothetical protein
MSGFKANGTASSVNIQFENAAWVKAGLGAPGGWAGETSDFFNGLLASGHGSDNKKRLSPCRNCVGQRGVRQFMGQILLAGEEPHERPALECDMVTDRSPQHWIPGFEGIQDRALRHRSRDLQRYFTVDAREGPQMCRENYSDHSQCVS